MSIVWKTKEGIISELYERSNLSTIIQYDITDNDTSYNITPIILSNTLPKDIEINHTFIYSENNKIKGGYFQINGVLPTISEDIIYQIVLRIKKGENELEEISDRYFEIKSLNLKLEWKDTGDIYTDIIQNTNVEYQIELLNKDGDETFKIVSGELPTGLKLSDDGKIYGIYFNEIIDKKEYIIYVKVYKNEKEVEYLNSKKIIFNIKYAESTTPAIWITNNSLLGNINKNEESSLSVLAYDPSNNYTIKYEIISGILPSGLELDEQSGKIIGRLETSKKNTYPFIINAYKIVNNEIINSEKEFYIITNNNYDENINWSDDTNLGSYKIGQIIFQKIPLINNDEIYNYEIIGGNFPKGLVLDKDGLIHGRIEYQSLGNYQFDIRGYYKETYIIKTFNIIIEKGLGKNSVKGYFRFNLEYKDIINSIKKELNNEFEYEDDEFNIDTFPKIDIANLTCYDKVILKEMLNFGNPEIIRIGLSNSSQSSIFDKEGNIIKNYDTIYKEIDESTLQWKKIDNGNYDFSQNIDEE